MQYLVMLLGCALGLIVIWKYRALAELIGTVDFAEAYLGSGGTYTLLLILGVGIFVLSIMYGTGYLQDSLSNNLGIFF